MSNSHRVVVDAATVWTAPDAPRAIDAAATADIPELDRWAADMDEPARAGLHGRTLTQLLQGEPVELIEDRGDWVRIAAPWQPHPDEPRGYPGWVRRAHLVEASAGQERPPARLAADRLAVAGLAAGFLGLRYLWGGTSPWGMDCSGLIHYCYRQAGVVIPRDAHAQYCDAASVPLGAEEPGDLYFFARGDAGVFHVGFVTARLHMLHAPEGGGVIEDAPLTAERLASLVAAGRMIAR